VWRAVAATLRLSHAARVRALPALDSPQQIAAECALRDYECLGAAEPKHPAPSQNAGTNRTDYGFFISSSR
jgi:hypothetical protein